MKISRVIFALLVSALFLTLMTSCDTKETYHPTWESRDQVFNTQLNQIRLGDGVPLNLAVSVRWRIEDMVGFHAQFSAPNAFDSLVLRPRQLEIASNVANTYPSVDSVFGPHRHEFIDEVKGTLLENLGEDGIKIKEVIISGIGFPQAYTRAMEEAGTKAQELALIQQQNVVDLEQAKARKKTEEANGEVAITQAKVQGELQKIQTKTEESRRSIELAKAETQRQVAEMQAKVDAKRVELLALAELKKKRDLNDLDVQKKRDLQKAEVEKLKDLDKVEFERQIELAKLCTENPVYASFLVNKELASKVQIAVLPNQTDGNVFGELLKTGMSSQGGN